MLKLLTIVVFGCLLGTYGAAAAVFPGDTWYTLTTENFHVHYADGYQSLAEDVAAIAEKNHPIITARLNHRPAERTHIILKDAGDEPGGFAQLDYSNVITMFTAPLLGYSHLVGLNPLGHDWMETLFVHEFTHIVHLDMAGGVFGAVRRVFGRVPAITTPNYSQSLALIEGVATYEETRHSGIGRGHSTFTDMFLRAATTENQLLSIDQVLGYYDVGRWDPSGGAYLYGYSWMAHVASEQGDGAVAEIAQAGASRIGPNASLRAVTGGSLAQLDSRWRRSLIARYAVQVEDIRRQGITASQPIGSLGWYVASPQFSPDGRYLAYQLALGYDGYGIEVIDRLTGEHWRAADGFLSGFSWVDSTHIVYSTTVPGLRGEWSDLYAVSLESGKHYPLTQGLRAKEPAVSADGKHLAFLQVDGATSTTHVWVASLRLENGQLVLETPEQRLQGQRNHYALGLSWHPVSDSLAVVLSHGDGRQSISVLTVDGVVQPLVEETNHLANAQFTPDGRYMLFESDRTGVTNLYAYDAATAAIHQMTNVVYGAFFPFPSPDGTEMAMVDYSAAGYQVSLMDLDPNSWRVPQEPFSGEYWQRAELLDSRRPAVSAGAFTIRRYNAASSMVPSWWLPSFGADDSGLSLGAVTAMADARRRHFYAVDGQYHVQSRQPRVSLSHRWAENSWGRRGWDTELALSYDHGFSSSKTVGYTINTSQAGPSSAVHRLFGGFDLGRSDDLRLGWQYSGANRQASIVDQNQYVITLRSSSSDLSGWNVVGKTARERSWDRKASLRVELAAGYAAGIAGFTLANAQGSLGVTGLMPGELDVPDSLALRGGVSWREPILDVYRGRGVIPVFLEQVFVLPFFEAGYLPNVGRAVASVGAKVGVSTSLGYGLIDFAPAVGLAYVVGGSSGRPALRVTAGAVF